jgi:hypothetical protein
MDLSFTITPGPRQRSHSQVRVPRDSWPHIIVSDSALPKLEGQVPVFITPSTGFLFRRLLLLAGLLWSYSTPPPQRLLLHWIAPVLFFITARRGPRRQHRSFPYTNRFRGNVCASPSNGFQKPVYQESTALATGFVTLFVSAGTYLPSHYPETNVVS